MSTKTLASSRLARWLGNLAGWEYLTGLVPTIAHSTALDLGLPSYSEAGLAGGRSDRPRANCQAPDLGISEGLGAGLAGGSSGQAGEPESLAG